MQKLINEFKDFWRNLDKTFLLILFFLGLFFIISTFLAGERLNKLIIFFSKHLIFTYCTYGNVFFSAIQTSLLKQLIIPTFVMIFILLILVPNWS